MDGAAVVGGSLSLMNGSTAAITISLQTVDCIVVSGDNDGVQCSVGAGIGVVSNGVGSGIRVQIIQDLSCC